jgi:hypothetical protein
MHYYSKTKLVTFSALLIFYGVLAFLLVNVPGLRCSNLHASPEDTQSAPGLGAFHIVKYQEDGSWRPAYSISFDEFIPEHCLWGLFRTPLRKAAIIKNLKLQSFEYTKEKTSQRKKPLMLSILTSSANLGNLTEAITNLKEQYPDFSIDIDTGAISRVEIRGLMYEIYRDEQLVFSIQCRLATAAGGQPHVRLNGHAKITSNSDKILESNSINWDLKKKLFAAKNYCLTTNESKTMGRAIIVDYELNQISTGYDKEDLEVSLCLE